MFPNGKYDDQIDSTSQALAWTKQRPKGWGIFEFYRQAAQEKMPPVIATVRLKPPSPLSTFFTITGERINCLRDNTFRMSEEDAKPLLGIGWQRLPDD
jgi:hypothetical protein